MPELLRKITQQNLLGFPTITSVSPTSVNSGDGTGNHTFVITGTGFTGSSSNLINNSGTNVNFDTVTVNSATQITGVIAKSSLPGSGEPYDVKVSASTGLAATLANQININQSPTYNTASGSLGTVADGARGSTNLFAEAFDPESAGNVTFEIQSGSLPAGCTLSAVHENGVSKAKFSGFNAVGSNTTSNFVLRAVDAASNTSSRAFSIQVLAPTSESFTSSGTFSVPSGVTSIDLLVVAAGGGGGSDLGGGGGAGGLIYIPSYPVTPGGTVSVTVGCGGSGSPDSGCANKIGGDGQDSVFGTLTAKGGGGGSGGPQSPDAALRAGRPGGSGGGGSGHGALPSSGTGLATGGTATQPTQPGNSGAYGFGNAGGGGNATNPAIRDGGGGGGSGAAGQSGQGGGAGGIGKAYTIADGTTSVYYAGGGAGVQYSGGYQSNPNNPGGVQGGGGAAPGGGGSAAQANKGGGGGANGSSAASNTGGKGIVIVRY